MKNLRALCIIMKMFFIVFKNYWKITNQTFVKVYSKLYLQDVLVKKKLHISIANQLQGKGDSIRKLEEQTNNLFIARDFFNLKQIISSINNFIILYNQSTKFDLFKFWKKLEEKGYDPVFEYSKSFEIFEMHYNPKNNDIFIIQI